jgi:hypothetical protein
MNSEKDGRTQKGYLSYLLRMWQESSDAGAGLWKEVPWRASLQSPGTGDLVGFASLDDLFDFLRVQSELESVGRENRE